MDAKQSTAAPGVGDEATSDDPFRRIAAAIRELVPGPTADQLLARIGDIVAGLVPRDLEQIAVENAQLQHEIEQMQGVDALTGLRNRQRFFDDLKREFAAARRYSSPLSLLLLDVDGLRSVN